MSTARLACPACRRALAEEAFFGALRGYFSALRAARFACPHCGTASEIQLENGAVWFGYVEGAGAAHFVGMREAKLDGLWVEDEGASLVVGWGDKTWRVNAG